MTWIKCRPSLKVLQHCWCPPNVLYCNLYCLYIFFFFLFCLCSKRDLSRETFLLCTIPSGDYATILSSVKMMTLLCSGHKNIEAIITTQTMKCVLINIVQVSTTNSAFWKCWSAKCKRSASGRKHVCCHLSRMCLLR